MSGNLGFHYDKLPHVKLEGNTFFTKKIKHLGHKICRLVLIPKVEKKMKNTKRSYQAKYKSYSVRILIQKI